MLTSTSFRGPRGFARWMLKEESIPLRVDLTQIYPFDGGVCCVLFREACWQAELVMGMPNTIIERHRHNRVDCCDLMLGGEVIAEVNGIDVRRKQHRGRSMANLSSVPVGVWHGGKAGTQGAVYVSFEHWLDGKPTWIVDDWEAFTQ